MEAVRKSTYAKLRGVSAGRVSQWLADGMISGEAIVGVGRSARIVVSLADAQLRERLDHPRRLAFEESDKANGAALLHVKHDDPEFASKRGERDAVHAELLRLRLARERGELVSRAAQLEAFETAGRAAARAWQALPTWADQIFGVCQNGDVPTLAAWLRAKANEQCAQIADLMSAPIDDDADDSADDSDQMGDN